MAQIFISYRRSDSTAITGRIYDRLRQEFGKDTIFKDVDNIPAGRDFRGLLRQATANCSVMLVIIGPNWVSAKDDQGKHRLDDHTDFVRLEVETGLQRDDVLVVPLIVSGGQPPRSSDLPDTLRELAYRNALFVRDDPDFHRDIDRLIDQIRDRVKGSILKTQPAVVPSIPMPTIKKTFTDKDRKDFYRHAFKIIKGYFDEATKQLNNSVPEIDTTTTSHGDTKFTCEIYRDGTLKARCKIWVGSMMGMRHECISYSEGYRSVEDDSSSNDMVIIEEDGQKMSLKATLGATMFLGRGSNPSKPSTPEQMAEYLWIRVTRSLEN